MNTLYFCAIPETSHIFGEYTDGRFVPTYFTSEEAAQTYFAIHKPNGVFAQSSDPKDVRRHLEFVEIINVSVNGQIYTDQTIH